MKENPTHTDVLSSILNTELTSKLNKVGIDNKIEYWDIRAAASNGTLVEFTDGKNKEVSYSNTKGIGVRAFTNGAWGFSVKQSVNEKSIVEGLIEAIKLSHLSEKNSSIKFKLKNFDPIRDKYASKSKIELSDVDVEDKIKLVSEIDKEAQSFDPRIINTQSFYSDAEITTIFINSLGSNIEQFYPTLRVFSIVFSKENGNLQRSSESIGGVGGYELAKKADKIGSKSAEIAITLLSAKHVKGGKFTIIMDPKLTGVFIHEAFGHACEADAIIAKESILEDKIGEKIARENVSIIDDPLPNALALFGSYKYDEEGFPASAVHLVEDGILKNYLHSLESASRMDVPPNGHGRASYYSSKPQVRMGVTYLKEGDWKLEEMIEDTKNGILCESWKYGYTNPSTGNFQFKTRNCYEIKNGEKTTLMRDAGLSGLTLEILNRVSAIGKKIEYSDGVCGKGGQYIRNCTGGPFLRVEDVVLGGLE